MVDARDDRAKRNIATALCNQLITTACGIVTLRVLLASFGSEAYGICASITQFLSNTISKIVQPPRMLESSQPTSSAGTASGIRIGSRVNASEKRICTSP